MSVADAAADLPTGTMVDHYRVDRLVGRGGMGDVYLAEDTVLGRKVALKLVGRQWSGCVSAARHFMSEARVTAALSHPNIVGIHGVGRHRGSPYLAFEYVAGGDLRSWLRRRTALGAADVVTIGLPIAKALAAAHRRGVIHRDVKPANIIVGDDERVRVLDFGLAEPMRPEHRAEDRDAEISGTPRYMAPELWEGRAASGAVDVWALGAIAYELASGRHPVREVRGIEELRIEICFGSIRELEAPHLAPLVRALIMRCLARDPAARPSMSEVVRVLRDASAPEPGGRIARRRGQLFTQRRRATCSRSPATG